MPQSAEGRPSARPPVPRDWDARTYDRIANPMTRWGGDVLGRLELHGDETVLDAGCGTGRVTEQLLARLPRGRVVALDGSPAMLEAARERLAAHRTRVQFVHADLARPLPLEPGSVDVVLSTATFHWIRDHDALFRHLAAVLPSGGRLVAQCGGKGNIARVRRAIVAAGGAATGPWRFASPAATRRRLVAAGFVELRAWLHAEPVRLEPGEPLREYLRTVNLGAHLERMPDERREPFVRAVADALGEPLIDYVRLDIDAVRGA